MNRTSPRAPENQHPSLPSGGFSYAQLRAQQIAAAAATKANQARRVRITQQRPGAFDLAAFEERKQQEQRRREAAARLQW